MAGGRTFDSAIEALAPFGRIVAYGIAGREQNEVQTGRLMRKSRAVVGFWLMHCLGRPEMMEEPLADLFERIAGGELRPQLGETYPMSEVRRAHEDLQGRRTSGKLLLDPKT
jgi:NADPH:quinone reductase